MKWLKNFIKATKSNKKLLSEHNEGMSHIKEYSDGSCIITTNKKPGSIDGVHYTDYVEKVKQLKREKKHNEAVKLLLQLVGATENESKFAGKGWGVAITNNWQLSIGKKNAIRKKLIYLHATISRLKH